MAGAAGRRQRSAGTRRTVCSVRARPAFLPVPVLSASRIRRQTRMSVLLISFGFCFWAHGYRQRKEIDETLGVLGVVAAHGEAGEVGAIERERRNTLRNVESAFPHFEADGAGDALLSKVKKS